VLTESKCCRIDHQRIGVVEPVGHHIENLDIIERSVSQLLERVASHSGIGVFKDAAPLHGGHEIEANESAQSEDSVTDNIRVETLFEQRAPGIAGLETGAQEFVVNRLH
jgi:hypothetical protein